MSSGDIVSVTEVIGCPMEDRHFDLHDHRRLYLWRSVSNIMTLDDIAWRSFVLSLAIIRLSLAVINSCAGQPLRLRATNVIQGRSTQSSTPPSVIVYLP